jgi:Kdo2-lipid IVA lauroyltransferase/acyltransferase
MALFHIKRQRHTRQGLRTPGPDQVVRPFHRVIYALLRLIAFLGGALPESIARAIGRAIGRLYWRIDEERRKTALLNLDQVFGDRKSEAQKQAIVKACCEHMGCAVVEVLTLAGRSREQFLAKVEIEGLEGFHEGLARGKGVILCSAHYGNWEIMNLALGYLGLPLTAMARPMDNPLVHRYLEGIRTRSGNGVIYKHKSVRKILAQLAENRVIGIVNDQDVHDRNRLMVPFFGRDAATTPAPAAVAHRTGAPLITGYAIPKGDGRYLLRFNPLLEANPEADRDQEITRLTLALNHALEAQILDFPDCWMWIHQRFKTGVAGRTDFYERKR